MRELCRRRGEIRRRRGELYRRRGKLCRCRGELRRRRGELRRHYTPNRTEQTKNKVKIAIRTSCTLINHMHNETTEEPDYLSIRAEPSWESSVAIEDTHRETYSTRTNK